MHKFLLATAVFSLLALSNVAAQTRSRVFDNFDTVKGVQIVTPTAVTPIVAPKNKKQAKKTNAVSAQTMNVQEGVSQKNQIQKTSLTSPTKMLMATANGLGGFTTGDATIDSYIVDSSKRYNIDPLLIYSQMHQESGFKLKATSYKGASGLMQLMPATAVRFGVTSIYDPKQNIDAGVKYMRWLLDKFGGDVVLALAGYNAGEGAVMKYGYQVPPFRETQEYVRRITTRYSSITNPNVAKTIRKVTSTQAAKLEQKESAPLTVYEPNAVAIKMPDGRMRLVNQ
jgi:soluble lytic murein transglycosylase-like protein